MHEMKPPQAVGLYHPENEHDACGVAFVAKLTEGPDHGVVDRALYALENLEHRGAAGADPTTGDGAGILLQLPDAFLRAVLDVELPAAGRYGVGVCFLPHDEARQHELVALVEGVDRARGSARARLARRAGRRRARRRRRAARPRRASATCSSARSDELADQDAFERKLYVIRRLIEKAAEPDLALPSLSSRTIVYKGMLTAPQMSGYFPDLKIRASRRASRSCTRASRRTRSPSWELAHPYRMVAHNGEINTLKRQRQLDARARVAARLRAVRRRPAEADAGRAPRWLDSATFDDVRARAARARGPPDRPRGDDDGARGLPRPAPTCRPPCAASTTITTRASWSRGTAPPSPPSPTAARSARRSTATACAPVAGCRRPTATSCSRPETGVVKAAPSEIVARAACTRARSSSSASSRAASSRTRR